MDRTNLKPFIGEVDHNEVLVGVAGDENLALAGVNDHPLDVGDETQRSLESGYAALVVQAGDLQAQRFGHGINLPRNNCWA